MKLQRYIISAAFVLAAVSPTNTEAKENAPQRVHMFGFAASFNDTIVHFTNIQSIDSVWIDGKNNFLLSRHLYSNMLRDYLDKNQMPHRTCIVIYDKSLKKLQKKYLKMKKLYTGTGKRTKNHNIVKDIVESDFKFSAVKRDTYMDEQENISESPKKKKKKSGK